MTVEQQVDALATAVDGVKASVATKKATLDASVADAQAQTALAQTAKTATLSARDQASAFKDAAYTAAQSAASAVAYQDLTALALSKAVTAVDVFIYDTSKDSDGGAWRHRCAGTSWYNETLNTATRGSRRDFPAVAVIVAEAGKVTIYDGDDPTLPMWRVFTRVANWVGGNADYDIKAIAAKNGIIALCSAHPTYSDYGGVAKLQFASDTAIFHAKTAGASDNAHGFFKGGLTTVAGYDKSSAVPVIVSAQTTDVAMTVLPDAPIDPATGLPVPTIAVATAGGVSVIKDDGTVVDIPTSGTATNWVGFNDRHQLASDGNYDDRWVLREIPPADVANLETGDATFVAKPYRQYGQSADYQRQVNFGDTYASDLGNIKNGLLLEYGAGSALGSTSLVALLTSTYNTGWMPGDIKGAFLSSTDTASLVGPTTDADRSVNNVALNVNGTITRSPVADGAELVAYSGFSAANYLEQPYNAGLDFGTGDFCIMAWSKTAAVNDTIIERWAAGGVGARILVYIRSDGKPEFVVAGATSGSDTVTGSGAVNAGAWRHICALKRGTAMELYVDGVMVANKATIASVGGFSNASAVARVGARLDGTQLHEGLLALLRISATAPTADQIRRIYEDEKALFQENAACTLYGASDAVTALAHDPDTGLLHVGTSAGRSVFKGLRRVANTTTPVSTAIAACGDLVVEQ